MLPSTPRLCYRLASALLTTRTEFVITCATRDSPPVGRPRAGTCGPCSSSKVLRGLAWMSTGWVPDGFYPCSELFGYLMCSCVESQFDRHCSHPGASYISLLVYSRCRGCLLVEQQLPSILSDHRPTIWTLSPAQLEQSSVFFSKEQINHDAPAISFHLVFGLRHPHWEHSRLSPCQFEQRCSTAAGISLPGYY